MQLIRHPFATVIPTSRRKEIFYNCEQSRSPRASVPQQVVPRLSGANCRAISSSPALAVSPTPYPKVLRGVSAGGGFPGEVTQELALEDGLLLASREIGLSKWGQQQSGMSTEAAGQLFKELSTGGAEVPRDIFLLLQPASLSPRGSHDSPTGVLLDRLKTGLQEGQTGRGGPRARE